MIQSMITNPPADNVEEHRVTIEKKQTSRKISNPHEENRSRKNQTKYNQTTLERSKNDQMILEAQANANTGGGK